MGVRTVQARQRLGDALRRARLDRGLRLGDVAALSDGALSTSHISNVEAGRYGPSRSMIDLYLTQLNGGPELLALHQEMERAIADDRAERYGASEATSGVDDDIDFAGRPDDADDDNDHTHYLEDLSIPDGLLVEPGQHLRKGWRVRNDGTVPWVDRYLTRVGPRGGPGQLQSPRSVPIADTEPGQTVDLWVDLHAPRMRSNPIAYFKMTDAHRRLYFPDRYAHGVMCIVVVTRTE